MMVNSAFIFDSYQFSNKLSLPDNVWSWGDGDYGKLGRGGSDGCKIPMKIESLAGLGVIKVECGSQFSVALTRSGSVYTWGKGDYHRLGHGNSDHIRRPKKVAALQGKKIVSIATGSLHCIAVSKIILAITIINLTLLSTVH